MKTILSHPIALVLITLTLCFSSSAQVPESFKYQAVIRGVSGNIISNQMIGLQVEILNDPALGIAVYTETFQTTSNNYGLINIEIGTGITSDNFSAINWENGEYFIRTSIDLSGGTLYSLLGTSQLVSVPYSLHSKTAEFAINDSVNDADSDPLNELQQLSLNGNDLSISDGNSVDLSSVNYNISESIVDSLVANNGYLTSIPSTTKSIEISPGLFLPTSFGTGASHFGHMLKFEDNITGSARLSVPLPSDWDGNPMTLRILYSSTGTSGDFLCAISSSGLSIGEAPQPLVTTSVILPPTIDQYYLSEGSVTLNLAGQNSFPKVMNLVMRRAGMNALDVSTDDLLIYGFVLEYNSL